MNRLLKYNEHEYFEAHANEVFLFETVQPIVKIAKLIQHKGSYYFDFKGLQLKAITTPCALLTDYDQVTVRTKTDKSIHGIMGGYGICNSDLVYVFWNNSVKKGDFINTVMNNRIPSNFPMPTALYSINNLLYLTK